MIFFYFLPNTNILSALITQLAIDYGVKFLETSAKSSLNVEEVSMFSLESTHEASWEYMCVYCCLFFYHSRLFILWEEIYCII